MRKNVLIFISILIMVLFTGCDSFSLPEEMIQKPKMDRKIGILAEDVISKLPASYEIILPKSLDHSAAINYADLTGDEKEEMIVLYREKGKLNEYGVRIYKGYINKWEYMDNISGSAADIQDIIFRDINNDGKSEIILMWLNQIDKVTFKINLEIYIERNEKMKKLFSVECDEAKIIDLDNDGIDDIVTFDKTEENSVKATLYNITKGENAKINEVYLMSDRTVRTLSVNDGKVLPYRNGIVVDMPIGSYQGYTEILVKEDKMLKKVFATDDREKGDFGITQSISATENMDIDNDGIIEINILYEEKDSDKNSNNANPTIQKWYNWDGDKGLILKTDVYFDSISGFRFFIPHKWENNYVMEISDNDNIQYVLIYYKNDYPNSKDEIARFAIIDEDYELEFKQKFLTAAREYIEIDRNAGKIYYVENNTDSDKIPEGIKVKDEVIKENFKILR